MANPITSFLLETHNSKNICITPLQFDDTDEFGLVLDIRLMKFGYLAHYIHSVLASIDREEFNLTGKELPVRVVFGTGGDDFSKEASEILLQTCAANYVNTICTARFGVLALPMISLLLKKSPDITVGFYLGYSEYRGESDTQYYSIKCLIKDGRFMTSEFKEKVNANFKSLKSYKIVPEINSYFCHDEQYMVDKKTVILKVVNPVEDYWAHLKEVFDINKIRTLIVGDFPRDPFDLLIDCSNGATSGIIRAIFHMELGLREENIYNTEINFAVPSEKRNLEEKNCWFIKSKLEERNSHLGVTFKTDGTMCLVFGTWAVSYPPPEIIAILSVHLHCIPFFQQQPSKAIGCPYTTYMGLKTSKPGSISTVYEMYPDINAAIEYLSSNKISLYADTDFGIISNALRVPDGIWLLLALLSVLEHIRRPVRQIYVISRKYYDQAYEGRLFYKGVKPEKAKKLQDHLLELSLPDCQLVNRKFGSPPNEFIVTSVISTLDGKLAPRIMFHNGSRIAYKIRQKSHEDFEVIIYVAYYMNVKKGMSQKISEGLKMLSIIATRLAAMKYFAGFPSCKQYF